MARRSVSTSSVAAGTGQVVSHRVFTLPNLVSLIRLAGVPLFVYLLLVAHETIAALVVLAVGASTDWVDGQLARRLNQVTRLGQLLDPITDRAYIVVTVLALTVSGAVPWQLTAVLVAREAVLALSFPVLWHHGYQAPLQVHYLGKTATFVLMFSFPVLLLATVGGVVQAVALPVGWALALWGAALYWYAGVLYLIQAAQVVRAARRSLR
ncbi:CDP-alcohol phosphatidyltransferase family protein [Actinocatenispora sera]|uniref:CDP-diacylglycerol--glycerol-3-phosphate 3-phosphatidyltransferase n=1 Tax=Actinocatenispora sera TaxID=390989 RepID=A0A810L863_9ACTN|nr:CDP-alcohol phosphatidyltransferase family protein [Actinocatenispora sera]BCJ30521.1 CDP-diacylglycerol--glycerol-3-phosphate 3-phosphatidyltransferase [Actinocatenispora sera]